MATERDQIYDELTTFKGIANNQEANKTELQREIHHYESEKIQTNQHVMKLEQDSENLKAQVQFEQSRFKELESVLEKERRGSHTHEK